ncbi:MAG: EthD family reductase [Candidatus Eremiobacteraeota bacterium]|nr:EthD family reductase [Candidatus Eremiobacteraeota bacterium]
MGVKLTVVYDNPTDPAAFEKHYEGVHKALAMKVPNLQRAEFAKVFPKEDGSPTPAYRTADLYFADYATACSALASEAGQAAAGDAITLATGGVKFLLSDIDD